MTRAEAERRMRELDLKIAQVRHDAAQKKLVRLHESRKIMRGAVSDQEMEDAEQDEAIAAIYVQQAELRTQMDAEE